MSKTFVVGDIHGAHRALCQCLERSNFDFKNDRLICLGDVCDGWPDTKQCIEEILRINHVTYIMGNHDMWLLDWIKSGRTHTGWLRQGGQATIHSYSQGVPESHVSFLEEALPYAIQNNKLFVHAGIDTATSVEKQGLDVFLWDRSLGQLVLSSLLKKKTGKLTSYEEIYIGHTPIPYTKPIHCYEVWMMDTGAGWSGVLTMMNVDTKEFFTSDKVPSLYPGVRGRQ